MTGSENYTTVYSYNDSQGKYKALLMSESKTSADEKPLPGFTTTAEKTTYTYDKNGSQLTKTTSEKTETNTYNAVNQLVGFTDGEITASYAYNASGLRYEKTVDDETVHHVWDGNQQIIADVVESQFYEANCYIRGTNLVATYHYQNGAKSDYTYYVQNAHGDVVNLTDADGAVTKTYHYDAFGVELAPTTGDVNVFRYCGEYFDTETGTVYLRARYYQAAIGRFTQRDSVTGELTDPLSLNLYTYCHNNPILYFDPSGHKSWGKIWEDFGSQLYDVYSTLQFGFELSSKDAIIKSKKTVDKIYNVSQKVSFVKGNGVSICGGIGPFGCSGSIGNIDATNGDYGIKVAGYGDISTNDSWQATITKYKSYDLVYDTMDLSDKCMAVGPSIVIPIPVAPWVGVTKGIDLNIGETRNGRTFLTGITIYDGFAFAPQINGGAGAHVAWGESREKVENNRRYDKWYDVYNQLYDKALNGSDFY